MTSAKPGQKEDAMLACVTDSTSSCSSRKQARDERTTTVTVRVQIWLLQKLREKGIANTSRFIRKLLTREIEAELTKEEKLETELDELKYEMKGLQDYHKTLLAHGSYAKDYMNKLKDGINVSHSPFTYSKEQQPSISREELEIVKETVSMREELNTKYREKLRELLKLKRERLGLTIGKEKKP
jgi:hypothetical protein